MLSQALEHLDLTGIHTAVALIGTGLSLYVMALTSHEKEDINDPLWLQWFRRVYLGTGALTLLWSLSYSTSKGWQPWPPEIGLMLAWIGMLVGRTAAIHLRIAREGHRPGVSVSRDFPTARG